MRNHGLSGLGSKIQGPHKAPLNTTLLIMEFLGGESGKDTEGHITQLHENSVATYHFQYTNPPQEGVPVYPILYSASRLPWSHSSVRSQVLGTTAQTTFESIKSSPARVDRLAAGAAPV